MTFLSYAPNSEDVLLWRALGDVGAGCYVEWAGEEADPGAVTRALYDRGWRGIGIRPTQAQADILSRSRPRDTAIAVQDGEHPTLPALVRTLGMEEVHVLRIDVAHGQAAIVAATLPLAPWLVLVRAGDAATEDRLAAAGFHAALYDGVTRFHVAAAHRDRLAPRLRAPANVTDGYIRVADFAMAQRLAVAEGLVAVAQARESGSLQRMQDALLVVGRARADVTAMAEESKWLRGVVDDGNRQIGALKHRVEELNTLALGFADRASRAEAALQRNDDMRFWRRLRRLGRRNIAGRIWRRLAHRIRQPGTTPPLPAPAPDEPMKETPAVAIPAAEENPALPVAAPSGQAAPRQAPLTAVHQFHAGSGPGDAITNGMLLIRTILRSHGFRSDIYVTQRPALLEPQGILMFDELPRHDGYLLLVHHSMGYPEFEQIVALPAPKILVYHNITPPHFLSAIPRIEHWARIGRDQLAMLRDRVVVALADSDYNAMELQALRFPAVRTCPLLFDVAVMKEAAGPLVSGGAFTILFVGRVTPSKGQDALVEAFAAFQGKFDRPSRLVLVGALDVDEHEFLSRLESLIDRPGLQDQVRLTGLVSDDELRDWYRQADLYVSLSLHEGFGVPLVEAMAHGVPVLAWPNGAVAETLGDGGTLLPSREPEAVAERMLAAALDARMMPRRPADLSHFALERHVPVLLQALATAGASVPPDQASHRHLAANLRFAVAGHVGKSYSLAAVNRAVAAVLEQERPGAVRVIPVEGVPTDDLSEVPQRELALIERLAARARPAVGPEVILSQHYPVYVPPEPAALKVALFFWEESLVPGATVAALCHGFDAVFAPSRFVARALVESGVSRPVVTIGHAPILEGLDAVGAIEKAGPFTFLHVSSAFPRKGIDVLLRAWRAAFAGHEAVRLVLKAFPNPHNDAAHQLARLRAEGGAAPVDLVDADVPEATLRDLLAQADAMVLPTRGEGYGLPAVEAMAAGIPLITTAHGGHMDFCLPGTARLVRRTLAASASHLATPHSLWAEPELEDLTAALREVFAAGRGGLVEQRRAARAAIANAANPSAWAARVASASAALLLSPAMPAVRIAWISSWNIGCGIAEYSRALLDAMPTQAVTILADDRTPAASNVMASWRLGDPENVARLVQAVGRVDADIVMIQHQPGLLAWDVLADLLAVLVRRGRVVMVTLHNTRHLVDQPESDRRLVLSALNAVARVLVHTVADIAALDGIGLANTAVLLPHAAPPAAAAPIGNLREGGPPVIGSTGFFLPGKGIGTLIRAVAALQGRWPGIRLRLVNAEYDHPESRAEIAACRTLAESEGLEVEWRTAFLPLREIGENLGGCDLLVLPYERSKEASSAALRTALGTGIPLAVTPIALFDEAAAAVARFTGTDAAAVAQGIDRLLADQAERRRLQAAAGAWLASHRVADIAQRLSGMMQGLAAQRHIGQKLDGSLWASPS